MATWQADFTFDPEFRDLPEDFRGRLDDLLPRGKPWSPLLETWGVEDGTRIDVWNDSAGATEVRLRVDLRSLDPMWLEGLLTLAKRLGRRIQTPAGREITDISEFILALRSSPAWSFVQDPEAYLRRIQLGNEKS